MDRAWQAAALPELDVAFVELQDAPDGTAQDVLGSIGVRFDTAAAATGGAGPTVEVLGFPSAGRFDGTRLRRCGGRPDGGRPSRGVGWPVAGARRGVVVGRWA